MSANRGSQDGALWYLAEYECGSIPCGPYDTRKEAACAVCGIPGLEGTGVTMRCSGYGTSASCPKGACSWTGHACSTACVQFRTNTSCPAECLWNDGSGLCQEPCEDFTTLDECPPGRCWWRAETCTSFGEGLIKLDEDGFALLLEDFSYFGAQMPDLVEPLMYGKFDMLKAVWKSGYVSNSAQRGPRPWQGNSNGNDAEKSFEFKKNSDFVVMQTHSQRLPTQCEMQEPKTTGDILCTVDFTLDKGDRVLASWYEATRQSGVGDNTGEIVVDIKGRPVI